METMKSPVQLQCYLLESYLWTGICQAIRSDRRTIHYDMILIQQIFYTTGKTGKEKIQSLLWIYRLDLPVKPDRPANNHIQGSPSIPGSPKRPLNGAGKKYQI